DRKFARVIIDLPRVRVAKTISSIRGIVAEKRRRSRNVRVTGYPGTGCLGGRIGNPERPSTNKTKDDRQWVEKSGRENPRWPTCLGPDPSPLGGEGSMARLRRGAILVDTARRSA